MEVIHFNSVVQTRDYYIFWLSLFLNSFKYIHEIQMYNDNNDQLMERSHF